MSVELLDEGPDDAETVFISWLKPLRRTAVERVTDEPLPMTVVNTISWKETVEESTAEAVVSVHTLCAKTLGRTAARDEADKTHRRILLLARYLEDVDLAGGRKATIDFVDVFEGPKWQPYGDDQILRKVGSYRIGLSYA